MSKLFAALLGRLLLRTHIVQYPDAPGDFRDGQH
jgi:hypothetical protein